MKNWTILGFVLVQVYLNKVINTKKAKAILNILASEPQRISWGVLKKRSLFTILRWTSWEWYFEVSSSLYIVGNILHLEHNNYIA